MAIPLVIGERVAGTLAAGSKDTRGFSKYGIALLTRVAGQASVAGQALLAETALLAGQEGFSRSPGCVGRPGFFGR